HPCSCCRRELFAQLLLNLIDGTETFPNEGDAHMLQVAFDPATLRNDIVVDFRTRFMFLDKCLQRTILRWELVFVPWRRQEQSATIGALLWRWCTFRRLLAWSSRLWWFSPLPFSLSVAADFFASTSCFFITVLLCVQLTHSGASRSVSR